MPQSEKEETKSKSMILKEKVAERFKAKKLKEQAAVTDREIRELLEFDQQGGSREAGTG